MLIRACGKDCPSDASEGYARRSASRNIEAASIIKLIEAKIMLWQQKIIKK